MKNESIVEAGSKTPGAVPGVVVEAVRLGKIVFFGEFRRGIAVEFAGKGGKLYHQSKCTVETEQGVITVVEFLPDNADWKTWRPEFTKGQMVFCVVRSSDDVSGATIASGKLELAI